MLRSARLTISLLLLGSGVVIWLLSANPTDAGSRKIFSQTRTEFTVKVEPNDADLARRFTRVVHPFITTFCTGCHSGPMPESSFDLQHYTTIESVVQDLAHWELVLRKLSAKEMPPSEMKQPTEEMRRQVIEWISAVRKSEAR